MGSIEDRVAHNESVFREINERIEAGHSPRAADDPIAFRCECAALGCNQLIELTIPAYERVRSDPHRFVVLPGHELAEFEVVLERADGYLVIEKVGEAGREAAAEANPRSMRDDERLAEGE